MMTPDMFLKALSAAIGMLSRVRRSGPIQRGRSSVFFSHKPWILAVALCLAVSPRNAVLAADKTISLESLLDEMANRDQLAKSPAPDFRLKQASSYDKKQTAPNQDGWFANVDHDNWLRIEQNAGRNEYVLMDHNGPGVLVRYWAPDKRIVKRIFPQQPSTEKDSGTLRIYLDGQKTPALEGPEHDLLNGRGLLPFPWGHTSLSSVLSYLPIPYARSCKITVSYSSPKDRPFYYQFTYRAYPPNTPIRSFSMDQLNALKPRFDQVGKALVKAENPKTDRTVNLTATLPGGKEQSVDLPPGPAAVKLLTIRIKDLKSAAQTRQLILKLSFDGHETVWCPIGDFFGTGLGINPLRDWYRTVSDDGVMTCRWIMPYKENARLTLLNAGADPVAADVQLGTAAWSWDNRSLYFHSDWRYERDIPTRPFRDWNYLTVTGPGNYVGDTLTLHNPVERWWGEGDEKIYVDNETFPSMLGTGTEDYYGYSWGGQNIDFYEHPFHAQVRVAGANKSHRLVGPQKNSALGYSTETRVRVLDTIPFDRALKLDMEVWHQDMNAKMEYAVATYWYGPASSYANGIRDATVAAQLPAGLNDPHSK